MWDLNVYTFFNITWIFKSQRNKNHRFYPQHYKFAADLYHTLGETYFSLNTDIQVYLTVWNPIMIPAEAHLILGQAERMDGITAIQITYRIVKNVQWHWSIFGGFSYKYRKLKLHFTINLILFLLSLLHKS